MFGLEGLTGSGVPAAVVVALCCFFGLGNRIAGRSDCLSELTSMCLDVGT